MNENFSIKWESISFKKEGKNIKCPLLRIKFSGDPSMADFIRFMGKIEDFTGDFDKEYLSLTDFSDLEPNKIIESLISVSSSNFVRSITFVSNQAKISFVLLGENSKLSVLREKLSEANDTREKKGYKYNYHFIKKESEIKKIAEKFFKKD